ncbi:MAG: VWA domain-containing protein [Methylococcales bacterium]|nr:VWA domain-containing protein [Methylococcales bacterium]MCK5924382.1 VWA domain-containing protein [Methylococcales bacterium]
MSLFNYPVIGFFIALLAVNVNVNAGEAIKITGALSQTKLLQQGANVVYMDVIIKGPKKMRQKTMTRATDMMIVLDRSASMVSDNKMLFAKKAIQDVLARLNPQDRFSLISFSSTSVVHSKLVNMNADTRDMLSHVVKNIGTDGSTNMGDGLLNALSLMSDNESTHLKKILLLSDGQVNQGIEAPAKLAEIVTKITKTGTVVSTIGMGLGFNESLLASLADYGMGHYSYLEKLSGLGDILEKDLTDTRTIFATGSTLDITLGKGMMVIDASGYPMTKIDDNTVRVTTGQILNNSDKHFVITFNVPVNNLGVMALGTMELNYQSENKSFKSHLSGDKPLDITIVEPHRRDELTNSINKAVYKKAWISNNAGIMNKSVSQSIRLGNKAQAKKSLADYEAALNKAEKEGGIILNDVKNKAELQKISDEIDEAFEGSENSQAVKRNRASKSIQMKSIKKQRSLNFKSSPDNF